MRIFLFFLSDVQDLEILIFSKTSGSVSDKRKGNLRKLNSFEISNFMLLLFYRLFIINITFKIVSYFCNDQVYLHLKVFLFLSE